MTTESRYSSTIVDIINRKFTVEVLRFANGNFVTISEGESKIGATVASIATGPVPASITVVPAKSESKTLHWINPLHTLRLLVYILLTMNCWQSLNFQNH